MPTVALLGQRKALRGVTPWSHDLMLSHDLAPSAVGDTRKRKFETFSAASRPPSQDLGLWVS